MNKGGAQETLSLSSIDACALFVASGAHDVDHPGTNNMFQMKTKSKFALLYND